MFRAQHTRLLIAGVAASVFILVGICGAARAQGNRPDTEPTNMTVIVREADSDQPVSQAHITLQFTEPRSAADFRKGKKIYYNAKTDAQGRCRFSGINKGPIVLTVTAPDHQSYGKELQLDKEDQVFEVKLKKPQPLT